MNNSASTISLLTAPLGRGLASPTVTLTAGLLLVACGLLWPPAGCIAGTALLAWGTTMWVAARRPHLAPLNLLAYSVPLLVLMGASADLLNRSVADPRHIIWLIELFIAGALMWPLVRRVTQPAH